MKQARFPADPPPPEGLGTPKLSPGQIEQHKQRVVRAFEALQEELAKLRQSMSAADWERFNQPL